MAERNQRKSRLGTVVGDKAEKTIVVSVQRQLVHPVYGRTIRRRKKYTAHDEKNECGIGDTVRIVETRPLSKTKRWRVSEIVEKAK
ncbi:MAG: 30S ribosomal protein S17 [Chitinivibrionales bacterium]|nr:30S ribosomal protein S17 [Chitinivibrionales bacterium]MBD3356236.1 30S ribosomal protein S17 [Chitinivibrionales bacterium]